MAVPARVAALLLSRAGLAEYRVAHRGEDPEVDAVLVALTVASAAWRAGKHLGSGPGTGPAPVSDLHRSSNQLSTAQVARQLGITPRAVVKAINQGRLVARVVGGRWLVDAEDVEHWKAARVA